MPDPQAKHAHSAATASPAAGNSRVITKDESALFETLEASQNPKFSQLIADHKAGKPLDVQALVDAYDASKPGALSRPSLENKALYAALADLNVKRETINGAQHFRDGETGQVIKTQSGLAQEARDAEASKSFAAADAVRAAEPAKDGTYFKPLDGQNAYMESAREVKDSPARDALFHAMASALSFGSHRMAPDAPFKAIEAAAKAEGFAVNGDGKLDIRELVSMETTIEQSIANKNAAGRSDSVEGQTQNRIDALKPVIEKALESEGITRDANGVFHDSAHTNEVVAPSGYGSQANQEKVHTR